MLPKGLVGVFLLTVFLAMAGAAANEKEAVFRGLFWGDPLDALEEVISVPLDEAGVTAYVKRGDRLELGPVPLEWITYDFFQEKLFRITLKFDHSHFTDILEMFRVRYGMELETNMIGSHYYWEQNGTSISLIWPLMRDDYISFAVFEDMAGARALALWQREEDLLEAEQQAKTKEGGAWDW